MDILEHFNRSNDDLALLFNVCENVITVLWDSWEGDYDELTINVNEWKTFILEKCTKLKCKGRFNRPDIFCD